MKTLTCYDCTETFSAESREEMLNAFYGHCMKLHKEIITGVNEEEKKRWMEQFEKDWVNAEQS